MLKALLVAMVVLLAATGMHSNYCTQTDKLKTVDIDMAEILKRSLTYVYVYQDQQNVNKLLVTAVLKEQGSAGIHMDCDPYKCTPNTPKRLSKITARNGIINFTYTQKPDYNEKTFIWYVLAKTNEGAMLVYYCDSLSHQHDIDERFIVVRSSDTIELYKFTRVPNKDIISNESANQLLAVDRSYNFTRGLEKMPYVYSYSG